MWKIKDSDTVNFKIISDVQAGHDLFVEELKKLPDLESAGSEYLHEYDVSKLGLFVSIVSPSEVSE